MLFLIIVMFYNCYKCWTMSYIIFHSTQKPDISMTLSSRMLSCVLSMLTLKMLSLQFLPANHQETYSVLYIALTHTHTHTHAYLIIMEIMCLSVTETTSPLMSQFPEIFTFSFNLIFIRIPTIKKMIFY